MSILNLTLINSSADKIELVKDWAVDQSLRCGSDHYALTFKIDFGAMEVDNIYGIKYNHKKTIVGDWQTTFKEALESQQPRLNLLLLAHPSHEQLEQAATAYRDCLVATAEAKVPVHKVSHQACPWWSEELNKLVCAYQKRKLTS
ncbi:hypothetical protein K439DRAFT_1612333 [Ramaria rubella]|nr:hypothetical protein K439DRAFT_1612333 [Ramaria rubella]